MQVLRFSLLCILLHVLSGRLIYPKKMSANKLPWHKHRIAGNVCMVQIFIYFVLVNPHVKLKQRTFEHQYVWLQLQSAKRERECSVAGLETVLYILAWVILVAAVDLSYSNIMWAASVIIPMAMYVYTQLTRPRPSRFLWTSISIN